MTPAWGPVLRLLWHPASLPMGQGGAEALWITLPSHKQKQNSSIYEIQQDCRSVDFPPPHHPPPQQQPAERKQEKAQNPGLCTVASGGLQKLMGPVGAQKVFKVSLIRSSQPDPTREFFFLTRGQPCKNQARKNNQIGALIHSELVAREDGSRF